MLALEELSVVSVVRSFQCQWRQVLAKVLSVEQEARTIKLGKPISAKCVPAVEGYEGLG